MIIILEPSPQLGLSESDIRLVEMYPNQLIFEWSEISYNCPFFHYRIVASNCGQCPNTTRHTTATCFGDFTESVNCSFSIQSVLCNDIVKLLAFTEVIGYGTSGNYNSIKVLLIEHIN